MEKRSISLPGECGNLSIPVGLIDQDIAQVVSEQHLWIYER